MTQLIIRASARTVTVSLFRLAITAHFTMNTHSTVNGVAFTR